MYRTVMVLCLISVIGFSAAAQTINMSGKVTNQSGKAIKGAIVTLAVKKLKDTTDAEGAYTITSVHIANPAPVLPSVERITMNHGKISISLPTAAPVKIEMFDLSGNLLKKVLNTPSSAGEYRFDVMHHSLAANSMVIRVSIGQHTSTFRYLPLNNDIRTITTSIPMSSTESMAKVQATVDTLKVSASNYTAYTTPISSYTTAVNVTLDTISTTGLDKFSFFVTSLKGIRAISGSSQGFGGDFRMGKTGQGAGLLGADSICQCLAEKSMPGSKVKQWRAFLSVSKGPDGKQVNAADRIGTGPWYDRIGRLVSNNLTDLLQERPASAHTAIKNDLPNEDGVPNHKPDGKTVDNHLTITGSGANGKLYSSTSTCDDWTSKTGKGGSKPRSGLSWPQAMGGGMRNWISVWDQSGCEPGIDSTDASMGGLPNVYTIGNGGGYGGFYCFALQP
jgi:hypothetical protein